MTLDEMIAVLQAAKEGKVIEYRIEAQSPTGWTRIDFPSFNFTGYEYRVRPERRKAREWWVNAAEGEGVCFAFASEADARQAAVARKTVLVREVLPEGQV